MPLSCVITPVVTQLLTAENPMIKLKARAVGNSIGFTLPQEAIQALKIKNGDSLYLTDAPDGYLLTPCNPEFARLMEKAELLMRRYKDALRQLAK